MSVKIIEKVASDLKEILELNELRLYDIEFVKEGPSKVLRIYIDKPSDKVSIDDCEIVSRSLSPILDEKDYIEDAYSLEVSSPGICRVLKNDWHFLEAVGEKVEIKLYKSIDGTKSIIGELKSGSEKGDLEVIINDEVILVDRKNISNVKIYFEF